MFAINRNNGFSITFENGWTASVQFGPGHYCQRRQDQSADFYGHNPSKGQERWESTTAEIAAFKDDEWHDFGDDTVDGFVRPAEVLAFINLVAAK